MWADASHADWDRFSVVVERHTAHLYDYCRALLTDRQDAADAALVTLLTAYSLFDYLQDTGRVRAWLLAVARCECRNANPVRSQLPPRVDGWSSDEPAAEDLRRWTRTGQTAAEALDALPDEEREVLDLVYRHYLSLADLAAVIGESADRASALLASAVTSFERANQRHRDNAEPDGQAQGNSLVIVTGVRAISTIPLVALPPSILADTSSIVADPEFAFYLESLESNIGTLGADGFPLQRAELPTTILEKARGLSRQRLVVLGGALAAVTVAFAAMASISSGSPHPISRGIAQALGQDPLGPSRASIRQPLPITALVPKKHDKGIVLPVLPTGPAALGSTSSRKPHPGSSPPVTTPPMTPSSTPTPSSPSPTPASPSPTPTSPSPAPSSPPPTPTASP